MLDPRHYKELKASGIDDSLIVLDVRSLKGYEPHENLLYSPEIERTNTGRVVKWMLDRYAHTEKGGWWCSGLDPLNDWQSMDWGCFKPDFPRRYDDGKLIKYEHPPRVDTRAFFPRVSFKVSLRIARRYGFEEKYWERISQIPVQKGKGFESLRAVKSKRPRFPKLKTQVLGKQLKRLEDTRFWKWVLDNKIPVCLTEGVKKTKALLSAGFVAVGLPGINGGYRRTKDENGEPVGNRQLIPELKIFQDHPIFLVFDRDSKQRTIRAVNNAIARTGQLLAKQGCEVSVITWKSHEKGVDDFLVANGVAAFEKCYNAAQSLQHWELSLCSQLTYPVNVSLNQKYLGKLDIPSDAKLLAIKSPKGSGKTELLAQIAADAMKDGKWVLILTHRVQLGQELCRRMGVPYITEVKECETNKLLGFGLCIDSLHPNSQAQFQAKDWRNGIVIIDECEQVFFHVLNSSTCKQNRVAILREFKTLITNALTSPKGQVILSDADLSDISVDHIRDLSGANIEPWVVENTWTSEGWKIFNYNQTTPKAMIAALEQHIEEGGKPYVYCSGQKVGSRYGTRILEAHLSQKFPDKKILRIDSETIADPEHPAFGCATQLNEVLPLYDIVLASPSLETGVSIDVRNHFTSVWGILQGVSPENSARQALARVREPVERHVWAASYGLGRIGNGATSPNVLLACQDKTAQANIALLKKDAEFDELDAKFDAASLTAWAKFSCRVNQGMFKYRDSVLAGLAAEGHEIIHVDSDSETGKKVGEELTETRNQERSKEAEAIAASRELDQKQYEQLQEKRSKTEYERHQERKYSLKLRYGTDVEPDLVLKDDKNWYSQIELHYYLTKGKEHLLARDKRRINGIKQPYDDGVWMPDLNKSVLSAPIAALEKLQVLDLMIPDKEFKGTDAELQEIAEKAIVCSWDVKAILNVTVKKDDSPIKIAQKLLGKLGLRLKFLRKEGARGEQQRVYGFQLPTDGREEVFTKWLERDEAVKLARENVSEFDTVVTHGNKESLNNSSDYQISPSDSQEEAAKLARENVSEFDTVVMRGNKESLNNACDYQTSPQSINEGSAAVRGGVETGVEKAVRVLMSVETPEQVTAAFDKLKRFPQEMKGEIWASVPDTRRRELKKMEKDGRRIAEIPSHLQAEILENRRKLLAATETETFAMCKIDYFSNLYEDWYYSPEEIRQIRNGIWLGLSEEQRVQICRKSESAEAKLLAESRKSFRAANHAPKPPFTPGQSVKFEGRVYTVTSSTHCHTQLKGIDKAVANWELEPLKQEADLATIALNLRGQAQLVGV